MKYEVIQTSRFKKSIKRLKNTQGFKEETFIFIVNSLASGKRLDTKYQDHKLTGNLKHLRECHLAPDILLIYQIDRDCLILTLVNVGNHSQLF